MKPRTFLARNSVLGGLHVGLRSLGYDRKLNHGPKSWCAFLL